MHRLLAILSIATLSTAACQKESGGSAPPTKTPVPKPVVVASVAISSAALQENCPDEKPAPEGDAPESSMKPGGEKEEEKRAQGDMDADYYEPCMQSSMQIAITGQGESSSKFAIQEVRLLGPKGAVLGTIKTRGASIWKDNGYAAWDQVIAPSTDVKASYKLTLSDWSAIEKKLGTGSYGAIYMLEADVEIDGVTKTIRSGQVSRERVEMIET